MLPAGVLIADIIVRDDSLNMGADTGEGASHIPMQMVCSIRLALKHKNLVKLPFKSNLDNWKATSDDGGQIGAAASEEGSADDRSQ
jgi:hypothetical protein